jgi:hypothetical protein
MNTPSYILNALTNYQNESYKDEREYFITMLRDYMTYDESYRTVKGARDYLKRHTFYMYLTISFLQSYKHMNKNFTEDDFDTYMNCWITGLLKEIEEEEE